jgi:hypothetical protein
MTYTYMYMDMWSECGENDRYERWEKLRQDLQQMLQLEEEQKQKVLQEQARGIAKVNTRNLDANRTVNKRFDLKTNELSTRPYQRTTYWAISSAEAPAEKDLDKAEAPNKPEPQQMGGGAPAPAADRNRIISEEELNADITGTANSNGHTEAPRDRASVVEDAVARAHKTELAVEVDTSSSTAAQSKKAEEHMLPVRTVNPLKPAPTNSNATSTSKVALSLEEYRRLRGLI